MILNGIEFVVSIICFITVVSLSNKSIHKKFDRWVNNLIKKHPHK